MDATPLLLPVRGWVGWGGILTFMYLAYIRGCYAAATCQGLGGVGWDINVHVPSVHTWMLRCCYVTGQGLGGVGWDINVHVPCVHTWTSLVRGWVGWGGILMLRNLAYIRGFYAAATSLVRGWLGWGGILRFMYLAYMRGCYAAAASETWSQKNLGDRPCPMLP